MPMVRTMRAKSPICQSWSVTSTMPFPFKRMPRTMRRKWVRGKTSPTIWAQRGMPRNGNMSPDSEIDGRKKGKQSHLHGLQLVLRNGGEGDSHRQVCDDENERDQQQQKNAPLHRHMKKKVGRDQNDRHLDVADKNVGNYLSNEHLTRACWHGEKIFHRAAFAFTSDGQTGDHDHCHG